MKKKQAKKPKLAIHRPSLRATVAITWLVFLTGAVVIALLWSWENIRLASFNASSQWPQLVRQGMEDTYRRPIVSASDKVFVLPELNISLPYQDEFADLRYNGFVDDESQVATITTGDIIIASTQAKGAPDTPEFFDLPYFDCNQVLILMLQNNVDGLTLLDSVELSDGRTLYVYEGDRRGADCESAYAPLSQDDFLDLVSRAQPYDL